MKHALIVGGSRGLGLGLTREHLARGWRVTATARTPSTELNALNTDGRLAVETLDINSGEQLAALIARLKGQTFDLLFLNPGIMAGRGAAPGDVSDSDIQTLFLT